MKTAIATSFDSNYFDISMVPLKALSYYYSGQESLDVFCLVPPELLSKEQEYVSKLQVNNLNIKFKTATQWVNMVDEGRTPVEMHFSSSCYHRVYLGSLLPDYDKVIYIDPDTIIMRDVSPLLNYPMTNKLLAVCEYNGMNVITFNDPDRPYFNNGVFIADLNYWRESDAESKMINFFKEYGPTLCPEQDAMNFVFIDVWAPLSVSFNLFHYWITGMPVFAANNNNPLIVHFVGPHKPWHSNGTEWEHGTEPEKVWHMFYHKIFNKFVDPIIESK